MARDETDFSKKVCETLASWNFHTERHEDKRNVGIPDISYGAEGVNGWIEVKWQNNHKLTPTQCNWLANRAKTGGNCFVLWGWQDSVELFNWQRVSVQHIWMHSLTPMKRTLVLPQHDASVLDYPRGSFTCSQLRQWFLDY